MQWQDFVELLQDDEYAEEQNWADHMEELAYLNAHPLDINTATREDLQRLPMLSDEQIEDIHTYIFLHRGMRSLAELMAIESLDYATRRVLSLFLYAGQEVFEYKDTVNMKTLVKKSRHELLSRMDIPLYYREGYMHSAENGGYKGSPVYNKVQYRMQSMNRVYAGFRAEKDQGEPFAGNRGYDSYGGYVLVKNVRQLRVAVLGDYKLGFGEGLVVNNGYSFGKSNMYGAAKGVKAQNGMDEHNFMRGAATTVRLGNVDVSVWFSSRRWDANKWDDGTVRTILTSGLHRTLNELGKKRNVRSMVTGGDVTWSAHGFRLGATGYLQHFDHELRPGDEAYRRYYPEGQRFGVMGLHYGYACRWFTFGGETAYSTEKQGLATLNRLAWKINSRYTLTGLQRFYSKAYYSFYASAPGENSTVQNENGAMLRLDAQPLSGWTLMAYADFFYNPWPRYQMTHSSSGQDVVVQNEYGWDNRHSLSLRYQLKRKEYSDEMQTHHRWRLKYRLQPNKALRLQSVLTLHSVQRQTGMSLSQDVRYKPEKRPYALTGMFVYFRTPDYSTRVFVYEPTLRSTFAYPSLFGHGMRFVATCLCSFWDNRLTTELKYGVTCYLDRKTQSSGMQQILSRWKNDLSVQIRLKV